GSRGSRKGTIKMMTTTVTLSDSVQKALSKLGVKTASQISECTHLVAPGLVRTEKLLCAIATGAFILSDKWAKESAAANKLLPEDDYILRDKENERKWNFRLVDAMARAKENGGKLFENKTFYVTSKVPTDTKLLKTVVSMQGGKIVLQSPTIRILNSAPNRYIISCREDIGIWRSLTKDHAIYTQELLLTAAMTQEIDWDNPSFRLE
ncbi:BRCT domain-containing protein, partial [Mycena vitilis]